VGTSSSTATCVTNPPAAAHGDLLKHEPLQRRLVQRAAHLEAAAKGSWF
jgi:hypothetical protein